MLEFKVGKANMIPYEKTVNGSGAYYWSATDLGKNYFIKVQEFDGSPMVEALVATLLGYVENLPKHGFMDYRLCMVEDEDYNQKCVGVCCESVVGEFVPITALCSKHKDFFGSWYQDYDDFSDFLYAVPNGLALEERHLGYVLECLKVETGLSAQELIDFFLKQGLVDTLVKNGARRLQQNTVLYDEHSGKYSLGPMYDFGNSLIPSKGMKLEDYPFCDFVEKCVAGDKNKLLRIRSKDFIRDWSDFVDEEYGMTDYFNLNFTALIARLRETEGILWLEA